MGVVTQRQALAAQLAARLAKAAGARVRWQLLARSGLTTAQTLQLLRSEPPDQADVAVVVTGVNDVVDQVPSHRAVAARAALAVTVHAAIPPPDEAADLFAGAARLREAARRAIAAGLESPATGPDADNAA